jgi:hypothetical protein
VTTQWQLVLAVVVVVVVVVVVIIVVKAIPLQAWTGPDFSRSLRLPDFKTIGTCRW